MHVFASRLSLASVSVPLPVPMSINIVKTPLLVAGVAVLIWMITAKGVERRLHMLTRRLNTVRVPMLTAGVSVGLALLLGYLAVRQFYTFTSEAYDLGIYSNALWHTVHGQWFFDSLKNEHLLGDHFGPVLIVFAQLYRIWESPVWLLLIQALALGLGAAAVGLLAQRVVGSGTATAAMLVLYVSNPYLHSIAALDFHPIALAVPLFLWLLYCFETDRRRLAWLLAGSSLFVEESLPPGLVGIGLYLAVFQPRYRWTGVAFAVVGTGWFLVEVSVFLPYFSEHALIHWDRYDNLGPDFKSALVNLLTDPSLLVREAFLKDAKLYYLGALLLSVGFLPLLAWRQAMLIALPALMMLLSDTSGHYKFGFHYSGVVLPFLFYSAIYGMVKIREWLESVSHEPVFWHRLVTILGLAVVLINIYAIRWSRLSHIDYDHVDTIASVLEYIPSTASVRAETNVVAALSSRHRIAPLVNDIEGNFEWWAPEYVVFDSKHVAHNPVEREARATLMSFLNEHGDYRVVLERDGVVVFGVRELQPQSASE